MKVLNISFSNGGGGAGIGAYRFHEMLYDAGLDSTLAVVHKAFDARGVIELPRRTYLRKTARFAYTAFNYLRGKAKSTVVSYNLVPLGLSSFINDFEADLVQLHWVGENTLSIFELSQIRSPTVWKLPDMWAFSGSKHYPSDPLTYLGSTVEFEQQTESRELIERAMRRLKSLAWSDWEPAIIGPSRWIADAANKSEMLAGSKVRHILNPLDFNVFYPRNVKEMRVKFGLNPDRFTILFNAIGGTKDPRKGGTYLVQTLAKLQKLLPVENIQCVVMGAPRSAHTKIGDIDAFYFKQIASEETIAEMYSTASVLLMPSVLDNLPNVVKEASACGVPTVAFRLGGLPDMVEHMATGYLADIASSEDLAQGIIWVMQQPEQALKQHVQYKSEKRHHPKVVLPQVLNFYEEVLANANGWNCNPRRNNI